MKYLNYLKEKLTPIALIILSILYLLEVDFSSITILNWIAFVIAAATLIPLIITFIIHLVKDYREKADASEEN